MTSQQATSEERKQRKLQRTQKTIDLTIGLVLSSRYKVELTGWILTDLHPFLL
jgi:hypothetical protein